MQIGINALGQNILSGTCPISGRVIREVFTCPVLQVSQIAKFGGETSIQGVIMIAESRYSEAQAIRAERRNRRRFLSELSNSEQVRFVFTRQETRWLRHPDCRRWAA